MLPDSPSPDGLSPDPQILKELVSTRMPFGKHKGELLVDLPEPYLAWFASKASRAAASACC